MSISKGFLVDIDVTEPQPADSAILRRRLLGVGVGGAAASLLPFLGGRASATTTTTSASTTTAASTTTTTAPPKRPTDDDDVLLSFAQTVEIAARELYDVALGNAGFDEIERAVIATIRESHDAYAASLSAVLGRLAPQVSHPIVDELRESFGGDRSSVLDAAYALESTAVATHTKVLRSLQGTDGAALIASILIVEARHGTVLANLNGASSLDELLVNTEADALSAEG